MGCEGAILIMVQSLILNWVLRKRQNQIRYAFSDELIFRPEKQALKWSGTPCEQDYRNKRFLKLYYLNTGIPITLPKGQFFSRRKFITSGEVKHSDGLAK